MLETGVEEDHCEELIKKLDKNTTWLGGLEKCFTIEKKSRIFIDEVLKYVCSKFTEN